MASNYPGSLDSFDTIASDKKTSDVVGGRTHRQMHNDLGDAIEAVQAELGTDPAGASATVKARFDAIEANDWVTSARIAANAVGSSELADNAVDTAAVANSAITSAKIADGAITAAKFAAAPGNLLTDNQASGTDTLSDTTGFAAQAAGGTLTSSTDYAYRGSRSLKCVTDGSATYQGWSTTYTLPLTRYTTVTVQMKVYATTQMTLRVGIYRAGAGYLNNAKTVTVPAGAWTTVQHTATPGAVGTGSTTDAMVFLDTGATAQAGTFYADDIGYWVGGGGAWGMPGAPVTETGFADSGSRDMSATSVSNGWAISGSRYTLRRIGPLVEMHLSLTKASATNDAVLTLPSGFRPTAEVQGLAMGGSASDDAAYYTIGTNGLLTVSRSQIGVDVMHLNATWLCTEALPTTLPGV